MSKRTLSGDAEFQGDDLMSFIYTGNAHWLHVFYNGSNAMGEMISFDGTIVHEWMVQPHCAAEWDPLNHYDIECAYKQACEWAWEQFGRPGPGETALYCYICGDDVEEIKHTDGTIEYVCTMGCEDEEG